MAKGKLIVCSGVLSIIAAFLLIIATVAAGKQGVLRAIPNLNASVDGWFTVADLDGTWENSSATLIDLSRRHGETWSGGYWSKDGNLHIVQGGRYALSGILENSSIVIEAGKDDNVWILLDGVTVHREDSAALRIEQAGKVFLTLASNTKNDFSDGGRYNDEDIAAGVDGVLYARDNLTINGDGMLTITSVEGHGIVCNDNLILAGGTVNVLAGRDGIHAHDSARFTGVNLTVNARYDGISAKSDQQDGYIYVKDGNITIPTCYEGLEAVQVIIDGGNIDIRSRDDGINAPGWGAANDIRIQGGKTQIINRSGRDADGFDSNKDVHITGGEIYISVPNDGSSNGIDFGAEGGGVLKIDGGTIVACGSSGMADRASTTSEQASILVNFTPYARAESPVILLDAMGKEILRWDNVPLAFNSVLMSSPLMDWGKTYTLIIGNMRKEVITPSQLGTAAKVGSETLSVVTPSINTGKESPKPMVVTSEMIVDIAFWTSILLAGIAVAIVSKRR